MRRVMLIALVAAALQAGAAKPAAVTSPVPTSYDCRLELLTARGKATVMWRLLPDAEVIETSGNWFADWKLNEPRLWLGWYGTDPEPLRPDSLASIAFGQTGLTRKQEHLQVRMELRVPGALGNIHWFAFATPYDRWNKVAGSAMLNWAELSAFSKGAPGLELRVVDKKGKIHATANLDADLLEEARIAASTAQGQMIDIARDFRSRCEPYFHDPYNRDIIL